MTASRYARALLGSAALHVVAFSNFALHGAQGNLLRTTPDIAPVGHLGSEIGAPTDTEALLPVQLESAASLESTAGAELPRHKPSGVEGSPKRAPTPVQRNPPSTRHATAAPLARQLTPDSAPGQLPDSMANALPSGGIASTEHGPEPSSPKISAEALHRAMQAAGEDSTPTRSTLVPPVVRVDPRETDLDRAFVRAFAWVFYIDPSFFKSVPTGSGRLKVELTEDGRIAQVIWLAPRVPMRLKELVQKMTKLLSGNHFKAPDDAEAAHSMRSYSIAVTEGHMTVDSNASGEIGDIWMLAAGERPVPGRPSHPAVADATGHKISADIRITE